MTYQAIQQLSQLIAGAIFLAVLIGVAFYTFSPRNKAKFERAANLPLANSNPGEDR